MPQKIAITGVKPTGSLHLGNYFGAIRPALQLAQSFETHYFIADSHALNTMQDPKLLRRYTYEIAASFIACGLNPEKNFFYRQSDLPEVFELTSILSNVTKKSTMNNAHAYKAATQKNLALERAEDDGINMGLYQYPILMAADILLFSAEVVPVGKDQVQHIEIARELAQNFNRIYGDILKSPEVFLSEAPIVIGLDGRKMSKSYNNTIPLFPENSAQLKKLVRQYQTDSSTVEEPKTLEGCGLFQVYELATPMERSKKMKERLLAGGVGWGVLKDALFEELELLFRKPREVYQQLMSQPQELDLMFAAGAEKARSKASILMKKVRCAIRGD
jgi:tryptophanyl-tRNA synthetase